MTRFVDRVLDASLNRASEGLRVLTDTFRFALDDEDLSARLKQIRHRLVTVFSSGFHSKFQLLSARDSEGDVGRPTQASTTPPPYRELSDLVEANFRRVEEALRSLEETLRLADVGKARDIENLRYETYDLQKSARARILLVSHRARMDFELYVATDDQLSRGRPVEEVARKAIEGGAGCIQLRDKGAEIRTLLRKARSLRKITREEGVTFIVNDSLETALAVEADGVHLGQEDFPLEEARLISRGGLLLGISTHSEDQAFEAESGGAGYINIGPIFPTRTKGKAVSPVTPELVRAISPRLRIPFTTMGGIHLDNVEEVILAGADRIAVVSEVVAADDISGAARKMVDAIRRSKEKREALSERS